MRISGAFLLLFCLALATLSCVELRGEGTPSPACANAVPEGRWFYTDDPANASYRRTIAHSTDEEFWKPRASNPAAEKMDSALLDQGFAAFGAAAKNAASFLVVRNGRMVRESYLLGHDAGISKNVHSSSKSILSAAIGIAISNGMLRSHSMGKDPLDERVANYLPQYKVPLENQPLTLRHLLTMTAGLKWDEDHSEEEIVKQGGDWMNQLVNLTRVEPPGRRFHYSTANTHLLSAILTTELKRNGHPELDTCSFVHRYLFSRIGVAAEFWGRDPQGYFSGGYDVYLTPRELAKFGLLFLRDGMWNGEQVVPAGWVKEATSRQVEHPTRTDLFYGYNWFVRTLAGHEVFYSWGFGGQHVFVVKDLDLVVVITTDTHDSTLPEYEDAYQILRDFIIPAAK